MEDMVKGGVSPIGASLITLVLLGLFQLVGLSGFGYAWLAVGALVGYLGRLNLEKAGGWSLIDLYSALLGWPIVVGIWIVANAKIHIAKR